MCLIYWKRSRISCIPMIALHNRGNAHVPPHFDLNGLFWGGRLRQPSEGTHSSFRHDLYYPGAANHNLCNRTASATNHVCDASLRFAPDHLDSDSQPIDARSDTRCRQVRSISVEG